MKHPESWSAATAKRIGEAVRAVREGSYPKVTAVELARRVDALGYPYSRNALVNLESGRKASVDISELLAIAYALRVPPITLLYPDSPDGPVEYVPGTTYDSWTAVKLFAGYEEDPEIDNRRIDLLRSHERALDLLERTYGSLHGAANEQILPGIDDTPEMNRMREQRDAMAQSQLRHTIDYIKRLRADMRAIGMTPPAASDFIDNDPQQRFDTGGQQ